ncbi:MAG: hypothetical protein LQ346_008276 [Caloplaca aetnensis]|nr:MAG: hypothetical protein LQ346_008276 [Caloplaca aetnensis]
MANQKKPKTWAEEIAELDDPAPKDFDPEAPENRASSAEDSEDNINEAREHYVEVEYAHPEDVLSRLRKPARINLGPEYSGSHISRNSLNDPGEASDDDPFASAQSRQGSLTGSSNNGEYADPENADLKVDQKIDEDEEINSDDAFGAEDGIKFQGFVFRGSSERTGPPA